MICCDGDQAGIRPALAARARRIEATMPGEAATDRDWRVLLGQEEGALSWAVMQRLSACLDAAAGSRGALLQCEGAAP